MRHSILWAPIAALMFAVQRLDTARRWLADRIREFGAYPW